MTLPALKQRYRIALNACITAQDRRRDTPRGPAHFEERFLWSTVADRCRLEYRRMERQIKRLEASA